MGTPAKVEQLSVLQSLLSLTSAALNLEPPCQLLTLYIFPHAHMQGP